jgi:hypothetical protein
MEEQSKYKEGDVVTFKGSTSSGVVTDVLINITEERYYYRVLTVNFSSQGIGLYPECALGEGAKTK